MTDQPATPAPQPGDIIIFFRPHRLVDNLIKIATLSKYYHVALFAGDGKVVEARPNGVHCNDIGSRAGGFTVLPAPGGKGPEALAWAKTQIGDGFDHLNMLVTFLEHVFVRLHLNIVPKGKYSCGEFVATAFYHAGVRLLPDQDLDDFEPKDFARLLPKTAQAQSSR